MTEKILILDFGSQYTQLIARAVREANVYCEIVPFHKEIEYTSDLKGIILSGSPFSVNDSNAPMVDIKAMATHRNVLGICYGAQLTAKVFGGRVERSEKREYGRAILQKKVEHTLLNDVPESSQVWMSHGDSILELPASAEVLATTHSIPVAAFKLQEESCFDILGMQFHPEVYHSEFGKKIIHNYLFNVCGCTGEWTPAHFITDTV
jgi:GMP synthase (glutamine-hydrolysing)